MSNAIHVTGSAGIVSTIPAILGFHPSDSLVVVGLAGEGNRRTVGPVARVDLRFEDLAGLGRSLARHSSAVIVVVYSSDPAAVFEVNTAALGLPVLDVVATGNENKPVHADLAAGAALQGRRTLLSRDELVRSIAWDRFRKPSPATAALLDRLRTAEGRDDFIAGHLDQAAASIPALVQALSETRPEHPAVGHLAATLAVLAYRAGDGTLANVAIDRAPGNRLARLLAAHIGAGLSPDDLHAAVAGGHPAA